MSRDSDDANNWPFAISRLASRDNVVHRPPPETNCIAVKSALKNPYLLVSFATLSLHDDLHDFVSHGAALAVVLLAGFSSLQHRHGLRLLSHGQVLLDQLLADMAVG